MKSQILKLLENDAKLTSEQISVMLDLSLDEVQAHIDELECNGTILGYKAVVDWEKTDRESVTAMIDVKLTPQRGKGYDRVAEKIYNYPEVKSVYLMSGAYDLSVLIEGKTMKEVAFFVSQKLAPIDEVISTATHFVLHKYKDTGVLYDATLDIDERGNCN
ncbi:MAG: Lrp/AsnC family transcriptional regulator [Ruminococcaceae bacterium]|nr:Lrp/AsnC family transcriptional regulator [Oscillospiraceae bacterium]